MSGRMPWAEWGARWIWSRVSLERISARASGGTASAVLARAMIAEREMHPGPVMQRGELLVRGLVDEARRAPLTKREAPKQAGCGLERGVHK